MSKPRLSALAVSLCALSAMTYAQVDVTVQNIQADGGFSFTPVWMGLHDGTFDVFDAGSAAGAGIVDIAELGDTSTLSARFTTEQPSGVQTTFAEPNGPPVFSPGESATTSLNPGDATVNRFFNYASMVVPSNDLFIGNDNAIELFDTSGNFTGPVIIDIFGSNVWDAGSEVNDITDGPAFVQGQTATDGTDEGGVVRSFFTQTGDTTYIQSILGVTTMPGGTISVPFTQDALIGRITIVPEPTAAMLLACCGAIGLGIRRRR